VALFAYRAVDADGRVSSGNLDAVNAIDLELRLKRLGLDLLTFDAVKRAQAARSRHVTRTELITFCFHLSQLTKAGVNIIEALTDLRDTVDNPGFRQVMAGLVEDIEGGLKLSQAMANHRTASTRCSSRWCAPASRAARSPKCSTSSRKSQVAGRDRLPRRGAR
jgi:type IV pilus assembly protein PilC